MDFPINNDGSFHSFLYVYQRVNLESGQLDPQQAKRLQVSRLYAARRGRSIRQLRMPQLPLLLSVWRCLGCTNEPAGYLQVWRLITEMAISLGFLQFFKHDFPCMKKMDASASFSAGGLERWMPMAMGKWTLRTWICAPSAVSAYLETYLETIQFHQFPQPIDVPRWSRCKKTQRR